MFTITSKTDLQLTWKIELQMPYNVNTSWFKQSWYAHLYSGLTLAMAHGYLCSHPCRFLIRQCIFSFVCSLSVHVWKLAVWLFFMLFIFLFKYHLSLKLLFKHWPSFHIWSLDYGFASICPVCLPSSPSADYGSVATSHFHGAQVTVCVEVQIKMNELI